MKNILCHWCQQELVPSEEEGFNMECPDYHCSLFVLNNEISKYQLFIFKNDNKRYKIMGSAVNNITHLLCKEGSYYELVKAFHKFMPIKQDRYGVLTTKKLLDKLKTYVTFS